MEADASFNTSIDSISAGLSPANPERLIELGITWFPFPTSKEVEGIITPSTIKIGVPAPRIERSTAPPGCGLVNVASSPAARPSNICDILLVAARDIFSVFTVAMEVVRFLRVVVPYPTTTTSSNCFESSFIVTFNVIGRVIFCVYVV